MTHNYIGKTIMEDNFVMVGPGHSKNFPKLVNSPIKDYKHEPSLDSKSGKEYVLLEDGQVFERYDCFVPFSPYGWKKSTKQIEGWQCLINTVI